MTDAAASRTRAPQVPDLEASVVVDAPPETVWDLIADVTRMGEWSPECYRCRWIGRERQPVAGARFVGFNRRGLVRWATTNVVEEAERGQSFAFRTQGTGARWSFHLEPDGDGTRLTQRRHLTKGVTRVVKLAGVFVGGQRNHDRELEAGMQQTVERIRAAAERAAGASGTDGTGDTDRTSDTGDAGDGASG
ncbi:MAG TPA: SRPBCC family protein [Acidimicrobiales bacterium]